MTCPIRNPFTTAAEWMLNKTFHLNHQRPLRVNRHRKHIADWRWQYSLEGDVFFVRLLRNGVVEYEVPQQIVCHAVEEFEREFWGVKSGEYDEAGVVFWFDGPDSELVAR